MGYQVWYHRRWLITEIAEHLRSTGTDQNKVEQQIRQLAEREVEYHLDTMQTNNSAWNHRYTAVRKTKWPLTDNTRQQEIDFTLKALRKCVNNESAWNYLGAFLGEGPDKVSWDAVPAVESFCREILALAPEREKSCRFAVEALARVHEARGEVAEGLDHYALLKTIDKIRASYWDWRAALLSQKTTSGAAS